MIHLTRTTVAGACMAAVLAMGPTASAASWQRTYLEPAIQAWMGVVTLLADDGEREGKKKSEPKCDGECKKGEACEKCDRKDHRKGDRDHGPRGEHAPKHDHGKWHADHMRHHGPQHGHMGPHHGPRGDAVAMLRDISARLARIERMLAARGPGGPPMHGHHYGAHHGKREGMEGPRMEMHERMRAAREKWENASSEERAEMKKKWEARMKEARGEKSEGEQAAQKAEVVRPMVEAARQRSAELENRIKRLESELQRVKAALESSGS